jgi:hypothetical protein
MHVCLSLSFILPPPHVLFLPPLLSHTLHTIRQILRKFQSFSTSPLPQTMSILLFMITCIFSTSHTMNCSSANVISQRNKNFAFLVFMTTIAHFCNSCTSDFPPWHNSFKHELIHYTTLVIPTVLHFLALKPA